MTDTLLGSIIPMIELLSANCANGTLLAAAATSGSAKSTGAGSKCVTSHDDVIGAAGGASSSPAGPPEQATIASAPPTSRRHDFLVLAGCMALATYGFSVGPVDKVMWVGAARRRRVARILQAAFRLRRSGHSGSRGSNPKRSYIATARVFS